MPRVSFVLVLLLAVSLSTMSHAQVSRGMQLVREGRIAEAAAAFADQAKKTGSGSDYYNMALAYSQVGANVDEVLYGLTEATSRQPLMAEAWVNLGVLLQQNNELKQALKCYQTAARVAEGSSKALPLYNVGAMLLRAEDLPRAHGAFLAARRADPKLAVATDGAGSVYLRKGATKTAQAFFQEALALQPDLAESYFNLGSIERGRGNWKRALQFLQRAAVSVPRGSSSPDIFCAQLYNNLGGALHALSRYEESLPEFDKAIRHAPNMIMAFVNKGEALRVLGRWSEAIMCTAMATSLDGAHAVALSNHLMYKQNVCDWKDWELAFQRLVRLLHHDTITRADPSEEATPSVSPYQAITFPFTAYETLQVLGSYGCDIVEKARKIASLLTIAPPPPIDEGTRFRVAYLSSDFGEHTTGVNVVGIFKQHNRDRVHVFAYATSPPDGSRTRKRTESEAETFRDLTELSSLQMAFAINADGIHVLVDLNGHTLGACSHVVALQPAPITIFDQGFAGSSGGVATHFNADKASLPPEYAYHYTEQLMYMPHFSNPLNDHRETFGYLAERQSRLDYPPGPIGLPEDKFIFGCFNTAYKYSPGVLDAWAEVLRGNSNASLWLLRWPEVEENLRSEARARGVSDEAVAFTPVLPKETHLRYKAALTDVFLDTFAFNGHGTVSQMLWAGVPSISLPAERIGQRIASALLLSSPAAPFIARDEADYVALALAVSDPRNHPQVQQVREQIHAERMTTPLFDIKRFVSDYERLLRIVWEAYVAGLSAAEKEGQRVKTNAEICREGGAATSRRARRVSGRFHSIVMPSGVGGAVGRRRQG